MKKRLVVGISGASCATLAVSLLQALQREPDWESHVIISAGGRQTLAHETEYTPEEVESMATRAYSVHDLGAAVASGTFQTEGMVIVPCSMKSLAAVAHGYSENLLLRAADVSLKERRKLVLVVRESPLSSIHLQNMLLASNAGAVILPPMLSMYSKPTTISALVQQCTARILASFGVHVPEMFHWQGME